MQYKKIFVMAMATAGLLTLSACNQETDQDRLMDAQFCLDQIKGMSPAAASDAAEACVAGIKDIQTTNSYVLQCSAAYIGQGFTSADKLSSALDQLQGNSGTTALLGLMAFSSTTEAEAAYDVCTKTNQKAMSLLSAMTKSATIIAGSSLSLITSSTDLNTITQAVEDEINQILTDLSSGDSTVSGAAEDKLVEVGSAVVSVYQLSCASGSQVNSDLCGQIQTALGSSYNPNDFASVDPKTVAQDLLDKWLHP